MKVVLFTKRSSNFININPLPTKKAFETHIFGIGALCIFSTSCYLRIREQTHETASEILSRKGYHSVEKPHHMTTLCRKLLTTITSLLSAGILSFGQVAQFSYHVSDTDVRAFAQDDRGYIWMGTANGLNRYNGTSYGIFHSGNAEGDLSNDNIRTLLMDSAGDLWIGTESGLSVMRDGKFINANETIYNPVSKILELDDERIVCMGKDGFIAFRKEDLGAGGRYYEGGVSWLENIIISSSGDIWFTMDRSDSTYVCILDRDLNLQRRHFIGMGTGVSAICETNPSTIWVATDKSGVICFDGRSRTRIPVPAGMNTVHNQGEILFLVPERKGDGLLIGIRDAGIRRYNPSAGTLTSILPSQRLQSPSYTCFVDKDNNIWLSDKQEEVYFYADQRPYESLLPVSGRDRIMTARLAFDNDGLLWQRNGDKVVCIDPANGNTIYRSGDDMSVNAIFMDSGGFLWIMSKEVLSRYRVASGTLTLDRFYDIGEDVYSLSEDATGQIWLTMSRKLGIISPSGQLSFDDGPSVPFSLLLSDPNSKRVFMFTVRNGLYEVHPDRTYTPVGDEKLRNLNYVITAKDGSLWCGTYNEGIIHYDEESGMMERFGTEQGIVDNSIRSIIEDDEGNIWFSSAEHITKYNRQNMTFSTIHDELFSGGKSYNLVSCAKSPDGHLYFGGTGGITVVDPKANIPQKNDIPLFVEYLSAGGKQLPDTTPELKLDYKSNILTIRFSGIDYESGSLLNYSYKMEGYEDDWQYISQYVQAVYSYLPAGEYTFRARVRLQNGLWSSNEINIPITIKAAPWASRFAKIMYLLLFIAVIGVIIQIVSRLRTQKERLDLAVKREELKQQHIDFVTNISHEFRTPLSMIYAPAKELAKSDLSKQNSRLVEAICRNAEQLKNLSEQILSSSGSRREQESLQIRQNDLVSVIRNMVGNFSYAAQEKNLSLKMEGPDSCLGFFDTEKVSKVCGNLISNAVKYTPEGGHVTVSVSKDGDTATISVKDDGIGIPENKRGKIFDRYERLGAENTSTIGSGIGLNYAYNLAKMHKGDLVYRPVETGGSDFVFTLPISKGSYDESQIQSSGFKFNDKPATESNEEKDGTIFVVEDNDEIRSFIVELLAPRYNIFPSSNGLEAEDNLNVMVPDLILSDVIMPGKGGYDLCRDIKDNPDTCHVPVILLTAKTDAKSSVEGMKAGADAYIGKPFDPDYLIATVETQIKNRRRLQDRVLNLTSASIIEEPQSVEDAGLNPKDKALLDKIHAVVDDNLENDSFNVADLADKLAMSYSSLYAKVKGLTGQTPQVFISTYRMNTAMSLLKAGELSVSEVAYKVGASSPFSFSREFKKHFGFPPSHVAKTDSSEEDDSMDK